MNRILLLFALLSSQPIKAQIKEFISYTDSIATNRYNCIVTFNSDDKGFTFTENRTYKGNDVTEYTAIIGTLSTIDTDSIYYGLSRDQKIWIKFQTIKGEGFDYMYSLKNKSKFIKHRENRIKNYTVELPEHKAKAFLKSIW